MNKTRQILPPSRTTASVGRFLRAGAQTAPSFSRVLAKGGICACLIAGLTLQALAAIEPLPFESELEEQRFRALVEELRCAVCQNQSLADSEAPLAQDLRQVVFAQLREGRSDQEIRQFMVDRYGDFVLYRPPVKGHTALLWFGPVLLLLGGLAGVALIVRKRKKSLISSPPRQSREGGSEGGPNG